MELMQLTSPSMRIPSLGSKTETRSSSTTVLITRTQDRSSATKSDVNSSSDITLDYSPSGALVNSNDNNPDSFTGEAVTNNIQPFITDANVYQGSPGSLELSYSEDVTESGSDESEFSLTGPDAVGIDSVNSTLVRTMRSR
jgi:hypothetical protein